MLNTAWALIRDTINAWLDDYAPSMGAALAFYTLFSIAPLLLIVISVAGLLFGEPAARGEILAQLTQLVGTDSAVAVDALLKGLDRPEAGIWGTLVGIVVVVAGATTVFAELQDAMDRIWRAPPHAEGGGFLRFLKVRLLSTSMVLGIGFLLMVSLVLSAAMAALGKWWAPWLGELALIADLINFALSYLFVTTVFAMIYKWMPRVPVAWRDVWLGAAITAPVAAGWPRCSARRRPSWCCCCGCITRRRCSCWAPSSPACMPTGTARSRAGRPSPRLRTRPTHRARRDRRGAGCSAVRRHSRVPFTTGPCP